MRVWRHQRITADPRRRSAVCKESSPEITIDPVEYLERASHQRRKISRSELAETVIAKDTKPEKRVNPRAKVSRMLRVRPSESSAEHFQELPVTVNVSKAGLYFHTHLSAYRVGMRLFVTYPFTFANDPMQSEYLAEVVRVEKLADSRFGIAVRLMMTV
jgi:hypothetical protein